MAKTPVSTNNLFASLGTTGTKDEENPSDTSVNIEEDSEELTEAEKLAAQEPEEEEEAPEPEQVTELSMLQARAKIMGINTEDKDVAEIRAAIKAKLDGEAEPEQKVVIPMVQAKKHSAAQSIRHRLKEEHMKLVRLRITNMDPKDKDLPGGIFTVANEFLGTVSKYVPFGEATENGYHVPYCIYKFMKGQKFLQIRTTKKGGKEHVEMNEVRKFALEVLDPLTPAEIRKLATAQLAAGSID
jgi:hypothetical protein